jgi:TRAP-type C4-dicarboxylate transport system substrate-binding protein
MGRLFTFLLAAAAAWFCLLSPDQARAQEPIRLTYAWPGPQGAFIEVQMAHWKNEVETRTGGQVQVQAPSGNAALSGGTVLDDVLAGRTDIGCLNLAADPARFAIAGAVGLPWSLPDAASGSRVLQALMGKRPLREMKSLKVLAFFTSAPLVLISTRAVLAPGELKGLDMGASGQTSQYLTAWDANPVGLPPAATAKALQMGLIKGVLAPVSTLKALNYAKYCPFVTLTDTAVVPYAMVMNRQTWTRLPGEIKLALDQASVAHTGWIAQYLARNRQEVITWARNTHKINFHQPSREEAARWNRPLRALTEAWRKQALAKGLPADEILGEIGALLR